ncbi:MAG: DUF4282 domain-containing protein [Ignavibacteria bacterium]|jgi:hypothetical protein|nr:DUF4282 domain-containing protein [Ignavibacteria bacterium]MDH7527230.1 DUF4282 domain-containing protein [Ignavibacteria bacterium]
MEPSLLNKFFDFDKMLTPIIIKIIFLVSFILSLLIGLIWFIVAISDESILGIILSLVLLIVGPLFSRILCENLLVFFKILEKVEKIEEKISST